MPTRMPSGRTRKQAVQRTAAKVRGRNPDMSKSASRQKARSMVDKRLAKAGVTNKAVAVKVKLKAPPKMTTKTKAVPFQRDWSREGGSSNSKLVKR